MKNFAITITVLLVFCLNPIFAESQIATGDTSMPQVDYATCLQKANDSYKLNDYKEALDWYRSAYLQNPNKNAGKWITYLENKLGLSHDTNELNSNQGVPTNKNDSASPTATILIQTKIVKNNNGEGYKGIHWGASKEEVYSAIDRSAKLNTNFSFSCLLNDAFSSIVNVPCSWMDDENNVPRTESYCCNNDEYLFFDNEFVAFQTEIDYNFLESTHSALDEVKNKLRKKYGQPKILKYKGECSDDETLTTIYLWKKGNTRIMLIDYYWNADTFILSYFDNNAYNNLIKMMKDKVKEQNDSEKEEENERAKSNSDKVE